jgi:hypothetical protein
VSSSCIHTVCILLQRCSLLVIETFDIYFLQSSFTSLLLSRKSQIWESRPSRCCPFPLNANYNYRHLGVKRRVPNMLSASFTWRLLSESASGHQLVIFSFSFSLIFSHHYLSVVSRTPCSLWAGQFEFVHSFQQDDTRTGMYQNVPLFVLFIFFPGSGQSRGVHTHTHTHKYI